MPGNLKTAEGAERWDEYLFVLRGDQGLGCAKCGSANANAEQSSPPPCPLALAPDLQGSRPRAGQHVTRRGYGLIVYTTAAEERGQRGARGEGFRRNLSQHVNALNPRRETFNSKYERLTSFYTDHLIFDLVDVVLEYRTNTPVVGLPTPQLFSCKFRLALVGGRGGEKGP